MRWPVGRLDQLVGFGQRFDEATGRLVLVTLKPLRTTLKATAGDLASATRCHVMLASSYNGESRSQLSTFTTSRPIDTIIHEQEVKCVNKNFVESTLEQIIRARW
jgi:hypothetical protein